MTEERPIPSDPELDAILGPERTIPRAKGVDRAALWGRLAVVVPALALPPSASSASPSLSAASSPSLVAAKVAVVKIGLAAFVGGVTAGIALDRAVLLREASPPITAAASHSAPPALVPASQALASPPPALPPASPPPALPPASPPLLASPAAGTRVVAVAPARDRSPPPVAASPAPVAASPAPAATPPALVAPSTLAEERELIDVAAAALGAGQLDAVRSALSRHRQRFPSGTLSEEREGLSVLLAIAQSGWGPAVEAQYTEFVRAFPQSPLRLRLQAARARALQKVPTDSPASPQ